MSTTTESQGQAVTAATTAGTTEQTSGSWELAVRRQAAKQRQASEAESTQRTKRAEACRLESLAHGLDGGAELLFHAPNGATAGGGDPGLHHPSGAPSAAGPSGRPHAAPAAGGGQFQQQQHHQLQQPAQLPHFELPRHGSHPDLHRGISPSPLDLFGDPFGASNAHLGGGVSGTPGAGGSGRHGLLGSSSHQQQLQQQQEDDGMLRIPSPPPFPSEWETGAHPGLLFDFDQFDINKRNQVGAARRWLLHHQKQGGEGTSLCHSRVLAPLGRHKHLRLHVRRPSPRAASPPPLPHLLCVPCRCCCCRRGPVHL
jgi:hypothetical protein